MDTAVAAVTLLLNFRAQDLGATPLQLGLLGFAWGVPFTACSVFTGRLLARFPRRALLTVAALLNAAVVLAYAGATQPIHLIAMVTLSGVANGLFWPGFETLLHSSLPGETHRRLGSFNLGWTLGLMSGNAGAGFLYKAAGPVGGFTAIAGFLLIVGILLSRALHEGERSLALDVASEDGFAHTPAEDRIPQARRAGYLQLAWTGNFFLFFASSVGGTLFPKLGRTLGFGDGVIGLILAVVVAAQALCFFWMLATHRWHYRAAPLAWAQALSLIGLILIVLGQSIGMFALGFALLGFGRGVTYTSGLYYSLDSDAAEGHNTGLHEAIIGSSMFLAPLMAGISATVGSLRAPFILSAALVTLAMGAQVLQWRRLPAITASNPTEASGV